MATLARVAGVFVRERGTRIKDRAKNGASKFPFLVLSLLRNQTEKLATQVDATRNPQLLLLLRTVGYVLALKLWPSVSITVITWWLFFIGLPVRATLNQEIPLVHVEKRPNGRNGISRKLFMSLFPWGRFLRGGDASFQVVWRTDLEVDLERTQNYFVELLALFFWLRRIIIYIQYSMV